MASWSKAFKGAVLVLIYSILWWIIGSLILFFSLNIQPAILSLALMLVGMFLIVFGAIASILKVASDM